MIARAVDHAADRLDELRHEEWEDGTVAAVAVALAIAAAQFEPTFALPLFAGAMVVAFRSVLAGWRRWDLLDRLTLERDAYTIPEVRALAAQSATRQNRRRLARAIRWRLELRCSERVVAFAEELEGLAAELEDPDLALEHVCTVACEKLLTEPETSPLANDALPLEDVGSRLRQIRNGFLSG